MYSDHNQEMEMQRKFPRWNKRHSILVRPEPFARMLAKIAYSYAIAEYGLSTTESFTPVGTDLILGRSDDILYTVGGKGNATPRKDAKQGAHAIDLEILFTGLGQAFLIVNIHLFANSGTPAYYVVAGQIRLDNPLHVAMFKKHRLDGKIVETSL